MGAMDTFSKLHFHDGDAARAYLERLRWPDGRVCSHCGVVGHSFPTKKLGVFRCAEKGCEKDFTVTTGTVMESSHIPLHKWLQAFSLLTASKKGMSAHQLHRTLKITYKSAWFMAHRVREAMRAGGLAPPMGSGGGVVEVDETFIGRIKGARKPRGGYAHKHAVLTLVDRTTKQARSFHIDEASASAIAPIVRENISREARMMTDEAKYYTVIGREVASRQTVEHGAGEYVRGEVHTNTAENYFSVFKRGMKGIYQHCSEKHLHRYLAEFDFRYNNRSAVGVEDGERATRALKGAEGKRLTYRQPRSNVVPFRGPEVR